MLIDIHIAAALTAFILGITVLVMPKGTSRHRLLGRTWVSCMAVVAFGSLPIRTLDPDLGMSWIHLLSVVTIISIAFAVFSIRNGRRRAHMAAMIGSFCGLVIAGLFTLDPDRHIGAFLSEIL